jgi:cell division protease FtsH
MDGFGGDAGIVVMGATNRPDILDPALLRPGRFDRQVVIDTPDVHGRYEILSLHAKRKPVDPDADLMEVAKLCPGFSGAELANVINEAALLTVREGRETIDQPTLEEAIDRVIAGPAKKSHVLSLGERQIIAVHEASHAVVAKAIGQVTSGGAQKLSIVARGRTLGTAASQLVDKDVTIMQEPDLVRQLTAIVAGAAGEKVQFGVTSTAINDDLHAATNLARSMVTSFGMSPELGMVTIGEQGGEVFLGASLQELGSVGPATLELIDREVERLVGEAVERASVILRAQWAAVREIAQVLLDHETVSGVALDALLTPVEPLALDDVQVNGRRGVPRPTE